MSKTKIPIIIINWNGIEDTEECIAALLLQSYTSFHIHLIDNGSRIDNINKLNTLYKNHNKISLYLYSENLGFAKAHNKLYNDHLKGNTELDYIVTLNNDTFVDPCWLENLIKAADIDNLGMVSSKMINYFDRDKIDNAGHMMLNTGEIIPIGHGEDISKYNTSFHNLGACAGACLYSKNMLDHIGFFDPHFSTGYEDAELGLRATIANYNCIFAPDAVVYHKMGQSIKKIFNLDYSIMIQSHIFYSYFKLMPTLNIIFHIPSFIFKTISMILIDIVFWRPQYLKVLFASWKNTWRNKNIILSKRKALYAKLDSKINTFKLSKSLNFFLWFDIKRFWKYIIKGQNSALDSYGEREN